jgi:rod shape-determining protein MreD
VSTLDYRPFAPTLAPSRARALPWTTVMAASAVAPLLPVVAEVPAVPPLGLLMLLTWRLLARFSLRPWAAAPLGLWDDLVSGQPLGSGVLIWSLAFLAIETVEPRLPDRRFWHDWLLAAALVAGALWLARFFATPLSATVAPALWGQVVASALLFPALARLVAWIDRKRGQG